MSFYVDYKKYKCKYKNLVNLLRYGGSVQPDVDENKQINDFVNKMPNKIDTSNSSDNIELKVPKFDEFLKAINKKLEKDIFLEQYDNIYCQLAFYCKQILYKEDTISINDLRKQLYDKMLKDKGIYQNNDFINTFNILGSPFNLLKHIDTFIPKFFSQA